MPQMVSHVRAAVPEAAQSFPRAVTTSRAFPLGSPVTRPPPCRPGMGVRLLPEQPAFHLPERGGSVSPGPDLTPTGLSVLPSWASGRERGGQFCVCPGGSDQETQDGCRWWEREGQEKVQTVMGNSQAPLPFKKEECKREGVFGEGDPGLQLVNTSIRSEGLGRLVRLCSRVL